MTVGTPPPHAHRVRAQRAAVLGSPIAHSRSPTLHRAAYLDLGLDWTYQAIELGQGRLAAFLDARSADWVGFSLTMPLKDEGMAVADSVDETAARTQVVNTLLRAGSGWFGANTDVDGLVTAIRCRLQDDPMVTGSLPSRSLVCGVIIGSGATARSAAAAMAALGVTRLHVCSRNAQSMQQVVAVADAYGLTDVQMGSLEHIPGLLSTADLCISTLPGAAAAAVPLGNTAPGLLLDVAYDPWPSALAQAWTPGPTISGLEMLLWQAVRQVELMTGQRPRVSALRDALHSVN